MCLVLSKINRKNRQPLIASEDLVCYKILLDHRNLKAETLLTYYQETPVKLGRTYTSEFSYDRDGDVERGLHSYKNLRGAIIDEKDSFGRTIIVKCVIPKGSRYYQGKFDGKQSYACDRLTYVSVVRDLI